jgi:uncharacterized protein (DUF1499 family)
MEKPSRVAAIARIAGLLGVVLLALGPLLVQLRLVSGFLGFRIFGLGLLAGLLALLLGALGVWLTRVRSEGFGVAAASEDAIAAFEVSVSQARPGRSAALTGLALGLVVTACVLVAACPGMGLPAINDITTDPDDPPAFASLPAYPPEFAATQREAYPDLAPLRVAQPPAEAFAAAAGAARGLGWEIVREDAAAGVLEATDTTRVFRFVDDVVVRVRPDGDGSRVDLRSKSRDGKGDLGANAARIRAFRERLAPAAGAAR